LSLLDLLWLPFFDLLGAFCGCFYPPQLFYITFPEVCPFLLTPFFLPETWTGSPCYFSQNLALSSFRFSGLPARCTVCVEFSLPHIFFLVNPFQGNLSRISLFFSSGSSCHPLFGLSLFTTFGADLFSESWSDFLFFLLPFFKFDTAFHPDSQGYQFCTFALPSVLSDTLLVEGFSSSKFST